MQIIRAILALAMLTLLSACGESTPSVQTVDNSQIQQAKLVPPPSGPRIALVMKTLTNPFFIEMEKGARRAQQETGVELTVHTASQETSIAQQIQIVEELIESRVDAIVIAPGDSRRLVRTLKKAQDAGIKVVNIDNRLLPDELERQGMKPVPFVSVDNEKAAYLSAKVLVDALPQGGEVVIIEGIRSADNAELRRRGAERAFRESPKLRLVASETASWKIDEAYRTAEHVFGEHPNIKAVFCANDMMALGVIKYLSDKGRSSVKVAGFDALEEANNAVRKGSMLVTVDQQAALQGYQGVMAAYRLLRGEAVSPEVEIEARLVTAKDLK